MLEIGSTSTGREDVGRKRDIYARIGVPEYWRFDPQDGEYHGEQLAGDRLVSGEYRPIELTTAPDGILKGYSPVLGLSLCWDNNWPRLYDPATNSYLTNWRQERAARQAEHDAYEAQAAVEQAERLAERGPARLPNTALLPSRQPVRLPRRASGSWRRNCAAGKRTGSLMPIAPRVRSMAV